MIRLAVALTALGWTACQATTPEPVPENPAQADAAPPRSVEDEVDSGVPETRITAASCFADAFLGPQTVAMDYDQFSPTVAEHCLGTAHQTISGIERVVFIGDSVTVGSPPTPQSQFYRSRLADALAAHFGLEAPSDLWRGVNFLDGIPLIRESGDFAACARYGARTDDLQVDSQMVEECFPPETRNKRTLVIMTMGGNDVAAITKDGAGTVPERPLSKLWSDTEEFVQYLDDSVGWLKDDPTRFPAGVSVVFANLFEFTDATGNVEACPAASIAGFEPWQDGQPLEDMVVWANEQYMRVAVDHQADMIFNLEEFCGHGFEKDNPSSPCYRGPGTERWYDDTCIHPNPAGHQRLADMFMAVVTGGSSVD